MSKLRLLVSAAFTLFASHALAVGGLVELTVVDRATNARLPVHWHEGRAYVAGRPGNEYTVTVRNRHGADLLAVVSVDGVNVVTGETASPQQSGYVISPHGAVEIRGWRKNLAETAAFYFTSLGDAYAARTGRPDEVGVIGVAVFKRRVVPPQPIGRIAPPPPRRAAPAPFAGAGSAADAAAPARESGAEHGSRPQANARAAAPEAPIGTGHGRREQSHARHVGFERATRDPVETVALYYDSRENLVARGVIREPVHIAPRAPRPFPGFVPDPVSAWPLPPSFGS